MAREITQTAVLPAAAGAHVLDGDAVGGNDEGEKVVVAACEGGDEGHEHVLNQDFALRVIGVLLLAHDVYADGSGWPAGEALVALDDLPPGGDVGLGGLLGVDGPEEGNDLVLLDLGDIAIPKNGDVDVAGEEVTVIISEGRQGPVISESEGVGGEEEGEAEEEEGEGRRRHDWRWDGWKARDL